MLLIILLLIIAIIFFMIVLLKWNRLNRNYNQTPLDIKTFDGYNSPYHPSVLYIGEGWNGYEYWMAETPYSPQCKPFRDRNECPSIHVSHDGINWTELSRANNPIDNLTEQEIENLDYFSDPHILLKDGILECWYRVTRRHGLEEDTKECYLLRKTTKDGVNWSEREVLVDFIQEEGNFSNNMVVSPAVKWQDGKYRMWYVDSESRKTRNLAYSESSDGHTWKVQTICNLRGYDSCPWHIDVEYIDGKYILVDYDFKNLTLWNSLDGIDFDYITTPIKKSLIGSFYGNDLYRSCIIRDSKEYKLYFSSDDKFCTHIGLLSGPTLTNLTFAGNKEKTYCSFAKYLSDNYKVYKEKYIFIFKHLLHI